MAESLKVQIGKAMNQAMPKIKKEIDESLNRTVAPAIKYEEHQEVYKTVYNVTEGQYHRGDGVYGGEYIRRYDDGGLSDVRNMHHTVKNGVLTVTNDTPPNPFLNGIDYKKKIYDGNEWHKRGASSTPHGTGIARLVEDGIYSRDSYGYDWWSGAKKRPFTQKTIEKLRSGGKHIEDLKKSLIRKGFEVE